ncbi:MAG TPA: hypothetical protein VNC16_05985 [Solirubrobacterales bacterium]|jgi:hypothetical protein|nr:hypothetical protein [Solirubrobacterales bacterium]
MATILLSLDQWADIAVILTGLGVLLVFYQVYKARQDSEVELVTGMTTMMLEVDRALIEYPEMRQYIGGGKRAPRKDQVERERALAVCTALANALDHVVFHLGYMNDDSQRAWRIYIAETYARSPVLRDLLAAHPDWWPGLQGQVCGLAA